MTHPRGFTLVETLVSLAIAAFLITVMSSLLFQAMILHARIKAVAAVSHHARLVEVRLTDAVRHAAGIDFGGSQFDVDPGVLSLTMSENMEDPTIFFLDEDNGNLFVMQAHGDAVRLTPPGMIVTRFVFTNLTSSEESGIIRVEFTLETVSNTGSVDGYAESFQTTMRIPLEGDAN
ncbi:prepilin-type N-terminal cleavage/methylation domain-containing protein [Candidatus Uhrbacteria bacterium]|nr:prepilin-type N-terminal cleavage/methylation domain-containing protein [Candidatus Uhrbacteria bacterium]